MYDYYRAKNRNEEHRVPGIGRIDIECDKGLGQHNDFFISNHSEDSPTKKTNQSHLLANMDLEDCVVPESPLDIHQSIHNLRKDPKKYLCG